MRMTRMIAACAALLVSGPALAQDDAAAYADAEALLEALETAADGIETLQAQIQYDRRFLLQGDRHVRRGTLYFAQRETEDGTRRRVFEVDFEVLFLGERREEDRQVWTFDGRWLVEKRPDKKQFIAREVAPPGATFDPLRLGEGPIPIPLGQEAEAVLERYDAELLPTDAGLLPDEDSSLIAFASAGAGSWQLRLEPRSEDDDFEEIRLWYEKGSLLPRMAVTTNRSGDVSVVQLAKVKVNEALPEGVFRVTPPAIGSGWDTQIEEYRGE
jgi:outer membrane lipoprotein-sorting protein